MLKNVRRSLIAKVLAGLLIIIGLLGGSVGLTLWLTRDEPPYPLSYEANFMATCINKGATAYACLCPLRYIETHYSFKQAVEIDEEAIKTGKVPPKLQQAFNDCRQNSS